MGLRDWGWLSGHVHTVGVVASFTVMLQCLLQLGEPLGHQMDVLQVECTTVSRTGLFVAQYNLRSKAIVDMS